MVKVQQKQDRNSTTGCCKIVLVKNVQVKEIYILIWGATYDLIGVSKGKTSKSKRPSLNVFDQCYLNNLPGYSQETAGFQYASTQRFVFMCVKFISVHNWM
jgi:hypothetical protein